jgi:glycerol kinase
MSYILVLDQGTTASSALTFDEEGHVATQVQVPLITTYPQPGWAEQDPMEIWNSQLLAAQRAFTEVQQHDAMRRASFASSAFNLKARSGSLVPAVAITNQRETTIVWDRKTGEPVYNALVWQDRRAAPMCQQLREKGHADAIRQKTGLMLDPYFCAPKLSWILKNVPAAHARAELGDLCFGTVDSWLIYKLTGGRVHVTDGSNASRTLLYNIHTHDWDDELLDLFDVPRAMLPRVVSSSGILGKTDIAHLGQQIPIAGVAGNQQAGSFGQLCTQEGMVKNTYGTGGFMLMNTGTQPVTSQNKMLSTIGWNTDDMLAPATYFLEGSVFMAQSALTWLRDNLRIVSSLDEAEALVTSVPDSGDVYLVPAMSGLGAPYWDTQARGCLIGMSMGTSKAHVVRATVESIALQTCDLFEALRQDTGHTPTELRVDGPGCHSNALMQIQADLLGVPVARPQVTQTAALGVAYFAGLATRFWGSPEELGHHWHLERLFEPRLGVDERSAKLSRWKRAVTRSRLWIG